ncbi:hypothetical protein B0H16DRAFT_1739162 [Mycena metata]|uniref:Uncharacterized protein n=1 Tax=Mycena metata TaxID=1033252 RepID=A0AAD7HHA8_9AGAR|nr:hypothetical protein B0H16DRAFT_1739162 [Mycena metata]
MGTPERALCPLSTLEADPQRSLTTAPSPDALTKLARGAPTPSQSISPAQDQLPSSRAGFFSPSCPLTAPPPAAPSASSPMHKHRRYRLLQIARCRPRAIIRCAEKRASLPTPVRCLRGQSPVGTRSFSRSAPHRPFPHSLYFNIARWRSRRRVHADPCPRSHRCSAPPYCCRMCAGTPCASNSRTPVTREPAHVTAASCHRISPSSSSPPLSLPVRIAHPLPRLTALPLPFPASAIVYTAAQRTRIESSAPPSSPRGYYAPRFPTDAARVLLLPRVCGDALRFESPHMRTRIHAASCRPMSPSPFPSPCSPLVPAPSPPSFASPTPRSSHCITVAVPRIGPRVHRRTKLPRRVAHTDTMYRCRVRALARTHTRREHHVCVCVQRRRAFVVRVESPRPHMHVHAEPGLRELKVLKS